jgi:hypothetical protein
MGGAAIWHRELLNERAMQSSGSSVTWLDRWISLGIGTCGFVGVMGAFVNYGDQPARTVAIHLTFLVFFLICILGLPLMTVVAGAQAVRVRLRPSSTPWHGGLLFALRWLRTGSWLLLGLWHGVLQFVIPLLWVKHGLSWAMVPGALLLVMMNYAGYRLALWRRAGVAKVGLVLLWLLAGATSLAIPLFFTNEISMVPGLGEVSATASSFWHLVITMAATGILTAVSSGLWFSWYLAVSLAFDRHNNEAGAVSRIADFAELVRIKLTPQTLSAYVIGIDRARTDGDELAPRLVDVFTLRVQEKQE